MTRDELQHKQIETIKQARVFILAQIKDLTIEQLNKIPAGFNNNIIWNIAHLIWAQQDTCYKRFDLPIKVDDKYFSPYRTGSKPDTFLDEEEIKAIKKLLISTIDELATDLENKVIVIDDAVVGLSYHDWLHAGYIMALKRLVN